MIRRFVDVSSGHLSPNTWAWLDAQPADDRLRDPDPEHAAQIADGKTRYGWFVYAPKDVPEGFPADLVTALRAGRALGAKYALFDSDAEPSHGRSLLHSNFLD